MEYTKPFLTFEEQADLLTEERGMIADRDDALLDSWLVTINTVRNICAHHGRLWNRIIGNPPMIPKASLWHNPHEVKNDKIFGTLTVLSYLLERVAPDTSWRMRLLDKVLELTPRNQERMGFKGNWRECPFWKPYVSAKESAKN